MCPSYVVCYHKLYSIKLDTKPTLENCIVIHSGNDYSTFYSLTSSGEEKEKYNDLCRKHNDTNYNKYRSFMKRLPSESVTYNDCDFTAIEITSDADYDEAHPAGTDLSDVVRFMSYSPYPYIMSGYKKYFHYDSSAQSEAFNRLMPYLFDTKHFLSETDATCYPIDKMVEDLVPEDLILLGQDHHWFIGMLYFEKLPAEAGEHAITVKMHVDNGTIFSDTIKMSFNLQ